MLIIPRHRYLPPPPKIQPDFERRGEEIPQLIPVLLVDRDRAEQK